jgi:5-methylcytosine-specific restriction endonuclease McrA
MHSYSRMADQLLLRTLASVATRDRATTAEMLALIAEVDKRQLFRDEGFPSMFRYCVVKLHMSEDVACKRIMAARAARRFPVIIPAVADGRLNVSTVALMSQALKTSQGEALLTAALGKSRAEVEMLIAERFPRADVPTTLVPVDRPASLAVASVFAAPVEAAPVEPTTQNDMLTLATAGGTSAQVAASTEASAPGRMNFAKSKPASDPSALQSRVAPLSPGRFELRLTISQALRDKLERARELLGHAVPSGDIAELLERALDELIAKQEKRQFAATDKPRACRPSSNPRHIPAAVKRAVTRRDRGRCTYESGDGVRCGARKLLQYDHVIPVARGGTSTVDNIRLRCRAHNQLEAECVFGAGFMEDKRTANAREGLPSSP